MRTTSRERTLALTPALSPSSDRSGFQSGKSDGRLLGGLLAPLDEIAANSPNLVANPGARFEVAGEASELPRYWFIGPGGGDAPIRIGIFLGLHRDHPDGSLPT